MEIIFPPQLKVLREGAFPAVAAAEDSLPTWNYQGKNSSLTIKAGFFRAGVAQWLEQLFCKQQAVGSNPTPSSGLECQSSQMDQSVKLTAQAYVGANPTSSTATTLG